MVAGAGEGETMTDERLAKITAWLEKHDDGRVIRFGDRARPSDTFMDDQEPIFGADQVNAMRAEVLGMIRELVADR
jgi:hypothetical protein